MHNSLVGKEAYLSWVIKGRAIILEQKKLRLQDSMVSYDRRDTFFHATDWESYAHINGKTKVDHKARVV